MSSPVQTSRLLTGLTQQELEILELLASGHTAKTIAARLGRSEASINERLRDARRKTGIGSSRELARLLAAQEIWDKNIDLSAPSPAVECMVQPDSAGRKQTKGKTIMLIAMPLAAMGLVLSATASMHQAAAPQNVQALAQQPPLAGTWALDVSRIPEAERPQGVTMTFSVSPDKQWTTQVDIVAPNGAHQHAQSTASVDGVPQPVTGNMDFLDTVALRQPAPNTLVMTLGKNGAPQSTRVYTVAKDRKSMTETIVWAGNSLPKLETTHFKRIR